MMIFDDMCSVIERWAPELKKILSAAHLFDFPYNPHEVLDKETDVEMHQFLEDHFFLPFSVTAVEDKASCVVLIDTKVDQAGLVNSERHFIECLPLSLDNLDAFGPERKLVQQMHEFSDAERKQMNDAVPKGAVAVNFGTLSSVVCASSRKFRVEGSLSTSLVATKNEMIISPHEFERLRQQDPDKWEEGMAGTLRNAVTAVQEILYFNRPDHFIVRSTPKGWDKYLSRVANNEKRKGKKRKAMPLARSTERPIYVFATVQEAKTRFGFQTTGRHVAGHARRRHYRTLRSEKFVNKRGQVIIIKGSWIGPDEVQKGNRRYKVLLDK